MVEMSMGIFVFVTAMNMYIVLCGISKWLLSKEGSSIVF